MHAFQRTALLAIAAVTLTDWAMAQCDIANEPFDGIPAGTPIDSLPFWSDFSPLSNVFVENDPFGSSGDNAIVIATAGGARRFLSPSGLPRAVSVGMDINLETDASFRMLCPNIVTPSGGLLINSRVHIDFQVTAPTPAVVYNYVGSTMTDSLPLVPGVDNRLEVAVDQDGDVVVHWNGQLLARESWAAGTGPCPSLNEFGVIVPGGLAAARVVIDNFCISQTVFTEACPQPANSTGVPSVISWSGTTSLSENDFALEVSDLPPNRFCLTGVSAAAIPPHPAGNGYFVCIGAFGRYDPAGMSNGVGALSQAVDWSAVPQPNGPVTTVVGQTWNFQIAHRDTITGGTIIAFTPMLSALVTL